MVVAVAMRMAAVIMIGRVSVFAPMIMPMIVNVVVVMVIMRHE